MYKIVQKLSLITALFFFLVGSTIQAQIIDIESTTEGFLPPRMTTTQRDAIPVGINSDGMIIFNKTTGLINYYDWEDSYWVELEPLPPPPMSVIEYFISLPNGIQVLLDAGETPLSILNAGGSTLDDFMGLTYQGGVIFSLKNDGSGLLAAPTDIDGVYPWGCEGDFLGVTATNLGAGSQNTTNINLACDTPGTAANECFYLSFNGFDDWFLPSRDELLIMHIKIGQGATAPNTNIGGFGNQVYFSSSEEDLDKAHVVNMNQGSYWVDWKFLEYKVRPIRAF